MMVESQRRVGGREAEGRATIQRVGIVWACRIARSGAGAFARGPFDCVGATSVAHDDGLLEGRAGTDRFRKSILEESATVMTTNTTNR